MARSCYVTYEQTPPSLSRSESETDPVGCKLQSLLRRAPQAGRCRDGTQATRYTTRVSQTQTQGVTWHGQRRPHRGRIQDTTAPRRAQNGAVHQLPQPDTRRTASPQRLRLAAGRYTTWTDGP